MSVPSERLSHAWGFFGLFFFYVNIAWAAIQIYYFVNSDSRFQTIYLSIIMGTFIGYTIGFFFFVCETEFYTTNKSQRNYRSYGSIPDNTTEDLLANSV